MYTLNAEITSFYISGRVMRLELTACFNTRLINEKILGGLWQQGA